MLGSQPVGITFSRLLWQARLHIPNGVAFISNRGVTRHTDGVFFDVGLDVSSVFPDQTPQVNAFNLLVAPATEDTIGSAWSFFAA